MTGCLEDMSEHAGCSREGVFELSEPAPVREALSIRRIVHPGNALVTGVAQSIAEIEVHEGAPGAVLQIATECDCWVLLAVRSRCVLDTVDGAMILSLGEVFVLPPGLPAFLQGLGRGEWLAIRMRVAPEGALSTALSGRPPQLAYGDGLTLSRIAVQLGDILHREDDMAIQGGASLRLAGRLLAATSDFLTNGPLRFLTDCSGETQETRSQALAQLLRMRFAAEHGDGAEAALSRLCPEQQRRALRMDFVRLFGHQLLDRLPGPAGTAGTLHMGPRSACQDAA